MRINWNYIKIIVLLAIVSGLYAFANQRSNHKKISKLNIEFLGSENLYISHAMVNKLLIQNYGALENVPKEKLVLNTIEEVLQANKMVKSAQVYLTVDGKLTSKIVQRRPIGRIEGNSKFYMDDEGKRMPLSKNHSARVPIITGKITGQTLEDAYVILKHINGDDFLRKNVIGIHITEEENYQLKFRTDDFTVNLGGVDGLEEKFNNFKAFYTKAAKDKTLEKYNLVSLEFNNQVVCTKI
ncbi:cell division protein FtsQ/DivIB [Costertonia aggregata]|uniref:Cell division protein FtsQ n=1 Tax=Costertonia aggregata TaxID=343403 RepID=A0A7H9ALZ3_9FLAO|nr:cell division protein FtsQ/DivIB [Costertonia aggregata]QLG44393.1 hypothetical protein HYG79_03210 [Costertonia aggregata]